MSVPSVFGHQELLIVKGIAPVKGDTASNEAGLSSINLLDETGLPGWSLDPEGGWIPKLPAIKGGGVWGDSAIATGRTLIAGEDGNVIEQIRLILTGTTILDLAARISAMQRMIADCRAFWQTFNQIEPVYLKWWALGAPGPQYALIYNLEMAIDEPDVWQSPIRDVTLSIEREPYWTPLAPGHNPKVWNYIWNDDDNYTVTDLSLTQNQGRYTFRETIDNNDYSANANYVEIDGADIPGDAPALVQLTAGLTGGTGLSATQNNLFLAVRSEPFAYSNLSQTYRSTFEASTAVNGTDAADVADATVATGNRVDVTPGTATDSIRLTFTLTLPVVRGRYAVYLRAYQNGGTAGDWRAHLEFVYDTVFSTGLPVIELEEQRFEVGATRWPMVYMGQIEIPVNVSRTTVGVTDARGIEDEIPLRVLLYARRTTGTSTLRISDLVFMPFDEGSANIITEFGTTKPGVVVMDNTGYLGHGRRDDVTLLTRGFADMRGNWLMLTPGKTQRIYAIRTLNTNEPESYPTATFALQGNILPRWRGIRDI